MMISFTAVNRDNIDAVVTDLSALMEDDELLAEIASSLLELTEEGIEVALSARRGILLARIFDEGRYSFVYPIIIDDGADTEDALLSIVKYARRELIPIYFTDVPREELSLLTKLFDHVDARAYDDDEDSFVALINSECDLIDAPPTVTSGDVTINALTEGDAAAFATLCRDREVNKYWGFDDTADEPNAPDSYFLSLAESELMRGVALSFAIRCMGDFVGEAVLFDFDYRGSAMVAVRLLAPYHGRGIGSSALTALIEAARQIGLRSLRAEVMAENLPSVRMIEKQLYCVGTEDGILRFELEL